jgi:rhamnogalacturonyl hydrolase YesR
MWTRDYLLNVRATLPFAEMAGVEGVACTGPFSNSDFPQGLLPVVYRKKYRYNDREYSWIPEGLFTHSTDTEETGVTYALTYCDTKEGHLYFLDAEGAEDFRVWVDGEEKATGAFVHLLIKGDGKQKEILVKYDAGLKKADFRGRIYDRKEPEEFLQRIPFVKMGGKPCADWLFVGPFTGKLQNAPEHEIQLKHPYPLGDFRKGFWHLREKGVIIRPYLDGIFFGQWFYAVQVGMIGILATAEALKNREYCQYFLDSVQIMADYFEYTAWEYAEGKDPTMIPRSARLTELDPCGTIGVSLIEAYLRSGDEGLLAVAYRIADVVMNELLRFEDDTYYRGKTMWADDFYMSCPFLARMARLTGQKRYADRVYAQVEGFYKRLWMQDEKLYSHIFFPEEGCPNRVPWGRGNGWVAVTLTEILQLLAKDARWDKTLEIYQEFARGIAAVQDPDGMWHQVLNDPHSYEETSCTAMFVLSLQRGIHNGWLDASYEAVVQRGWEALLRTAIDDEGNIHGVCMGSGCSMDAEYFARIPTHCNDDHGTGIILMAAAELLKSESEKRK